MTQLTQLTMHKSMFDSRAITMALVALVLMIMQSSPARAQWTTPNGQGNISNTNSGNVGVGTSNPLSKLQVNKVVRIDDDSGSANGSDTLSSAPALYLGTTAGGGQFQFNGSGGIDLWQYDNYTWAPTFTFTKAGRLGIGMTNPSYRLQINAASNSATADSITVQNAAAATLGSVAGIRFRYNTAEPAAIRAILTDLNSGTGALGFFTSPDGTGANITERMRIDPSGNVGIGTTNPTSRFYVAGDGRFTGNLTVDGNIAAKYQDMAEWVESSQSLAAGTVVVLDHTRSNQVIASSQAYDTRVAGVISAQPGIMLGEKGESKVLVATTGRVKVKVDATSGPIQIGDLLVTSDMAGVAKKSEPLNLGGVALHRPGTLIGKALEPLAKGTGEILVLLSLQ